MGVREGHAGKGRRKGRERIEMVEGKSRKLNG
jgi:hypothetical protein